MNLDKKLAKYARKLDNPKYYKTILKIIDMAAAKQYRFKEFSNADIMHILDTIDGFFEVNNTPELQRRVIEYFNKIWLIVSDKHYILIETPYLGIALSVYVRCYLGLLISKLTKIISPKHYIGCVNVDNNFFLFRGALKVAEYLNCEVFDLDEYKLENNR